MEQNCNTRSFHKLFLIAFALVSLPKPCCSIEVWGVIQQTSNPPPLPPDAPPFVSCAATLLCWRFSYVQTGCCWLTRHGLLPPTPLVHYFRPDRPNKRKKKKEFTTKLYSKKYQKMIRIMANTKANAALRKRPSASCSSPPLPYPCPAPINHQQLQPSGSCCGPSPGRQISPPISAR